MTRELREKQEQLSETPEVPYIKARAASRKAQGVKSRATKSENPVTMERKFLLFLLLQVSLVIVEVSAESSEMTSLLTLKSSVDVSGKLPWRRSDDVCHWYGVKQCSSKGQIRKLVLESLNLTGNLKPEVFQSLSEIRVLSFKFNSLSGKIPDFSGLRNLKILFLDGNRFSGEIPPGIAKLRRLRVLSLSRNVFSGEIPTSLTKLPKLRTLFLRDNRLSGAIPAFNQDGLEVFDVSGNSLSGEVPRTKVLLRFNSSAFSGNVGLCGEQIRKQCSGIHSDPFLSPPEIVLYSSSSRGEDQKKKKNKRIPVIISSSIVGFLFLVAIVVTVFLRKKRGHASEVGEASQRVFSWEAQQFGKLTFCGGGGGEKASYTLEELLKASAETLGRGSTGSTYKAVMESGVTLAVTRLRENPGSSSSLMFRRRAEVLGLLRHQNLVPLRAFFEAERERLLVYDYFPNGSLLSLVQGDKPLHWTSCLKIAEDVATGLAHLHEAAGEVHGNLKCSNVLLGPDFECCLVDYALTGLHGDGRDFSGDMYSFGMLVLELVGERGTCKETVGSEEVSPQGSGSGREQEKLATLVEVAMACVAARVEDRPTAGEALRMVRAARAAASSISGGSDQSPGRWSDAVQSLPRASNGQDHMNHAERD